MLSERLSIPQQFQETVEGKAIWKLFEIVPYTRPLDKEIDIVGSGSGFVVVHLDTLRTIWNLLNLTSKPGSDFLWIR